jgi:hypothetical protein
MLHRVVLCALGSLLGLPLGAQPVISARAGLIHFSEGAVILDGRRIEPKPGKFEQMRDGSELRTRDGRAEVLLAPGVFLRVGEDSAIRMISNRLVDTQLEFLTGAAILNAAEASLKAPVTIAYQDYEIRIHKQGRYRFESIPAELRVESGEADAVRGSKSIQVGAGYVLPFSVRLEARKADFDSTDTLDQWDAARNGSIAENNLQAAQTSDLGGLIDTWQNDPAAALEALGMSSYIPPPVSTSYYPYGYSTFTSPYGMMPLTPLGIRFGPAFGFYPIPLYRYSPIRPVTPPPGLGYRPPYRPPSVIGAPRSPVYSGPPARVGTPAPGTPVHGVHGVGHR